MSKNLKNYSKFRNLCKKFVNEEIVDIILFGSIARGKTEIRDLDICIIFRKKIDPNIIKKYEELLKNFNVHISSLTIDEFFTKPHSLIKTLLNEGISLISNKKLANNFNLKTFTLYTYNLDKLKKSDRVRFVYIMRGRKGEGAIERNKGQILAPSCFLIPIENDSEIKIILDKWNIKYSRKLIYLS